MCGTFLVHSILYNFRFFLSTLKYLHLITYIIYLYYTYKQIVNTNLWFWNCAVGPQTDRVLLDMGGLFGSFRSIAV